MAENEDKTISPIEKGQTVTQSVVDQPLWELLAQRIKRVDVTSHDKPYLNSYVGGMGIGIVLFLGFFLVGQGFGDSGALTRMVAFFMNELFPQHTEQLVYFKRYLTTSSHPLNHWIVYMLIGIALGGLVSGLRGKRMKKGFIKGPNTTNRRRIVTAFIGGMLVTFGARMAGGCITGMAMTGTAMLGVAGWIFFLSVLVSGLIVAFFVRREWL
ncbi:MAG: YeeE/YedE family protein [Proteobacteria bacterium]|nr:YeeE/YedE family protein [Pseudomonadota bacterium]